MFKTMFYDRKDITYYIEDSIDYKKWNSLSTAEKDACTLKFNRLKLHHEIKKQKCTSLLFR